MNLLIRKNISREMRSFIFMRNTDANLMDKDRSMNLPSGRCNIAFRSLMSSNFPPITFHFRVYSRSQHVNISSYNVYDYTMERGCIIHTEITELYFYTRAFSN